MKINKTKQYLINELKRSLKEDKIPFEFMYKNKIPINYLSNNEYKGINKINLWMAEKENNYNDPRWITFKQAERLGLKGKINAKGKSELAGKGIPISFVSNIDKITKKTVSVEEINKMINEGIRTEEDFYFLEKDTYVFNLSLFEGVTPYINDEIKENSDIVKYANNLLNAIDLKIENTDEKLISAVNPAYCFYSAKVDKVFMPNINLYQDSNFYYGDLLHEVAHATSNEKRLNRKLYSFEKNPYEYAKEELRAEIASAFICSKFDNVMPNYKKIINTKAYVQSWISMLENKPEELITAIRDATIIEKYCNNNALDYEMHPEKFLKDILNIPQYETIISDMKNSNVIDEFYSVDGKYIIYDNENKYNNLNYDKMFILTKIKGYEIDIDNTFVTGDLSLIEDRKNDIIEITKKYIKKEIVEKYNINPNDIKVSYDTTYRVRFKDDLYTFDTEKNINENIANSVGLITEKEKSIVLSENKIEI